MKDVIKSYQTSFFNMYLNGSLSEEQFDVLTCITEHMETDLDALELSTNLTLQELENKDLIDCILAKQFKTAMLISE